MTIAAEFLERSYRDTDVDTATSIANAIASLDDENVECVVSDYAMDDGDGIDLLEGLRDRDIDPPFILFTRKSEGGSRDPPDVTAYFQKEMGTGQYQKLGRFIERLVSEDRAQ